MWLHIFKMAYLNESTYVNNCMVGAIFATQIQILFTMAKYFIFGEYSGNSLMKADLTLYRHLVTQSPPLGSLTLQAELVTLSPPLGSLTPPADLVTQSPPLGSMTPQAALVTQSPPLGFLTPQADCSFLHIEPNPSKNLVRLGYRNARR